MRWLHEPPLFFEEVIRKLVVSTLREQTVVTIAVLVRIFFIPLSGENPETVDASDASFPAESFQANASAFPRVRPSSPLFKRESYLNFLKSNKKNRPFSEIEVPPNYLKKSDFFILGSCREWHRPSTGRHRL
jgi:hypothetical protein